MSNPILIGNVEDGDLVALYDGNNIEYTSYDKKYITNRCKRVILLMKKEDSHKTILDGIK